MDRREFLAGTLAGAVSLPTQAASIDCVNNLQAAPGMPAVLPRALRPGDTIGLVSPAAATYEIAPIEMAVEAMRLLGFKVKESRSLRARYGHFAGTDAQRAGAVNEMFGDPEVNGILALTGGSGCTRIVDHLDYSLIRRNPKFFGGFSDITALLNGIHSQTGLVTFYAPFAMSEWNAFSQENFRRIVIDGAPHLLANPPAASALPVSSTYYTRTIRPGKAAGRLVGGNLSVFTSLAGSRYIPSLDGAILFIEDINEYIYRVDRLLAQLRLIGAFDRLAGVVIGQFTDCKPGDGFGTLTLDEVFEDYFGKLGIPVFSGCLFGHIREKLTVPIGVEAEMDADARTIRLLHPAVSAVNV
ncbi:MAG: LD-carboxypeptidase [Betaproteobacteria bacterium]|nr:LD-carboxypeptidase [Betaproteobacteria bacterium]